DMSKNNALRPKTSRGELTRQKILDAAKREIGGRGFAEASISTITAEAGVGQGTFYLYFRTKEDVLRELVLHMGRKLRRHLTLAVGDSPSRI
ncbi:TetR/AcrR family transcriptional regulator, partial [Acinetobacter baumannii]